MRMHFYPAGKQILPIDGESYGYGSVVEIDEATAAKVIKAIPGVGGRPSLFTAKDGTPVSVVAPVVDKPLPRIDELPYHANRVSNPDIPDHVLEQLGAPAATEAKPKGKATAKGKAKKVEAEPESDEGFDPDDADA